MTPQTIDLDTITAAEEATQKVGIAFDDDGNPTVGFVIVGKDSHQYRSTEQRLKAAAIRRGATKSQRIDTKTEEGSAAYVKLMQQNEEELAAAVVVGWFGFSSGGQPAPFSAEAVRRVLKARPTYRDRITAALENEAGFLLSSPTSSPTSPEST